MDTYSLLREFADSWFLIVMTLFYLGCIAFAFRPGACAVHAEISQIPLREDDAFGPGEPEFVLSCSKDCANCACKEEGAQT